ncbi:MAG: hypothetical protein M1832_001693 [Thelocarpon impressellum]|nr:MAG: hypothetical protein M1832_001693 [Thelocarpon impressellum]
MGRIKKSAGPKHEATLPPALATFVKTACVLPLSRLPAHVATLSPRWPFPRGDLYNWIPLLNRFDNILGLFIQVYGLQNGPQTEPFGRRVLAGGDEMPGADGVVAPGASDAELDALGFGEEGDRELVEAVLAFSTLLLENCGNRSLYSSSGMLNDLLNTTSLTLLLQTLRLGVRCAQRYLVSRQRTMESAQNHSPALLASHYNINLEKVTKIAGPFLRMAVVPQKDASPSAIGKEKAPTSQQGNLVTPVHATDLVSIARGDIGPDADRAWDEWGNVTVTYFPAPNAAEATPDPPAGSADDIPATPTPTPARTTAAVAQPPVPRRSRLSLEEDPPDPNEAPPPANALTDKMGRPETLEVPWEVISSTPVHEILAESPTNLREEARFELLNRLRVSKALTTTVETRRQILAIRILALTNLAYIHVESVFVNRILQQDADEPRRLQLAYQLAELVHPSGDAASSIPRWLQTLALGGLEAVAKHKAKVADVCAALSVNVSHGVLLYVVRKAVAEMADDQNDDDPAGHDEDEWRDALFSLLAYLPETARTGEAMVSAGLLPVLLEVLTLRTNKAERNHPRILNFLDTSVYHMRDALQTLVNARGLDVISDLTAYEVESSFARAKKGEGMPPDYRNQIIDYEVPFFQQQSLRFLFKFMNHMMSHGGGNFDRLLRNLIDSPQLLGGLRTILTNAGVFGSNVWSGAVHILSNFIHNEPTSYAVIAEAGLSKGFLEAVTQKPVRVPDDGESRDGADRAVDADGQPGPSAGTTLVAEASLPGLSDETKELNAQMRIALSMQSVPVPRGLKAQGILPSHDAILVVPQAFGAICLSSAGMKLFKASNALESFFEVFVSPEHVTSMHADDDLPNMLGSSFDELVRHHPALKEAVMVSILHMLVSVGQLCRSRALSHGVGAKLWVLDDKGRCAIAGAQEALLGKPIPPPLGPTFASTSLQAQQVASAETEDFQMGEADAHHNETGEPPETQASATDLVDGDDETNGPSVSTHLDVMAKFLTGFFANASLCSSFIEMGGAEWLLDLTMLPSLPHDFNNLPTSHSLARVVHMLVEQKPHLVLPSLIRRAQVVVDDLKPFYEHDDKEPFFKPLVERQDEATATAQHLAGEAQRRNEYVKSHGTPLAKSLVSVHTLCNVLRESFSQRLFNHRSSHTIFSQVNIADMYAELVTSLGALQRACVLEEILLQKTIPDTWKEATRLKGFGARGDEPDSALGGSDSDLILREGTTSSPAGGTAGDTKSPKPRGEEAGKAAVGQTAKTAQVKNVQTLRYLLSRLPSAITPFFQGLGKVLVPKRQFDSYQKQNAVMVAEAIAEAVIAQLQPPSRSEDLSIPDKHAFWIVMLTSLSQLMIEVPLERPQPQSLTLVLQAFKNKGGFQAVKHILELFVAEIENQGPDEQEGPKAADASARVTSSYHGIKIILAFFSQMVTAKNITEASQTTAMASRDRDRDKPDYFSPNQFLVELRMAVLPVVQSMWESGMVDRADSSIAKSLINILRTILDSDHEGGAYKRSDKISRRTKPPAKPWKESLEHYATLMADDFEPDLVREALYRCNNNLVLAEDYCKAHKRHDRALRLPYPEPDVSQRASRPHRRVSEAQTQAPTSRSIGEQGEGEAAASLSTGEAVPPSTSENEHTFLHETLRMDVEAASGPSPGTVPAASSSAPLIPGPEDAPEYQGSLMMNIDNLLGNLGNLNVPNGTTPPLLEGAQGLGNEASHDASSASPSRDNGTEAGKLAGVVTVDDLEELRAIMRGNLIDRSLDILNVHSDVTFELADLIMTAVSKAENSQVMRGEIAETLVPSLMSLQLNDDFRPAGKKIAAYANLLGLILQDKAFYEATLGELRDNFSDLLGFIKIFPDQPAEESSPWIGQILLIIERLFAEDAQPRAIKWTLPTSDAARPVSPVAQLEEPVISIQQKTSLFVAVVEILPRVGQDASLALSIVRVLVMLTRNRQLALRMGERRNLQRLFVMVKQLGGMTTEKLQSGVLIILRHVIEDEDTLRQIMRSEIRAWFESVSYSTRHPDTNSYVRNHFHLALRAPEIFVEVSNDILKLVRFDVNQRHQLLALKDEDAASAEPIQARATLGGTVGSPSVQELPETPKSKEPPKLSTESSAKEKSKTPHGEVKAPVVEHPDGIIHYLLSELLSYKDVEDKEPKATPVKEAPTGSASDVIMTNGEAGSVAPPSPDGKKNQFKPEQHPIYFYRCFILQCLTELLSCYNRTKIEFINFSRKASPQAMTPSKPRSGVLNYLLNDVIPGDTLIHAEEVAYRKKFSTSNWAIAAVVALCSKTGERGFDRHRESSDGEDEPDLLFVRRFVLEHALKAYRDATASAEPLDRKYARMLSLSDLFNRMLTGRPISGGYNGSEKMIYASQKQLARIMFEKNYISALTSSISDIDLNFPSAKRAIKYILRPLKQLTQTAIELSESGSISTTPGQTDEDEISSATSVSDVEDGREETPDLFRNSTLGMFEPGREQESSSESSDGQSRPLRSRISRANRHAEDEDMYDDEYGEEMEYEEEVQEEDGDVVSDEDEELEGMEGLPGDIGLNVEVVLNEEEDGDESDDDEDDSEDVDEREDLEIVDEINGDDENDSARGDEGEEWQSDDDDDEDYQGNGDMADDDSHDPQHDNPLEHIVRAIEGIDGTDMLQHLEGGDLEMELDPEGYMEDALQDEDEDDEDDEDMEEDEEAIYEHEFDGTSCTLHFPLVKAKSRQKETQASLICPGVGMEKVKRPSSRVGAITTTIGEASALGPTFSMDLGIPAWLSRHIDRTAPLEAAALMISQTRFSSEALSLLRAQPPVSLINNLINAIGQGGGPPIGGLHHHAGALHFHIAGGPVTGGMPREIQAMLGIRRPPPETSRGNRDESSAAINSGPSVTSARWQEAAGILFGGDLGDKMDRVVNALLSKLVPPAIEEEKKRREKSAEDARQAQKEKEKLAEEEAIAKAKADQAAQEKLAEDERRANEERIGGGGSSVEDAEPSSEVQASAGPTGEGPPVAGTPDEQAMEGVETTQADPETPTADAVSPGTGRARVHTTIRGTQVEITDLEIDPDYLDALPEELREEVLMHQFVEQRSQRVSSGEQPTDINPEFLQALPDDIREELLEQEAQDRRRREREEARRIAATGTTGPPEAVGEDMDPATVLATLDPSLRQAILMEQDEDVLAQLPQALAAEARALGGEHRLRHNFLDPTRSSRARGLDVEDRPIDQVSKKPQRRTIVQMLDKPGVATLLRLMFIPQQGSSKQTLNGVLQNICENRQTRHEVITLLLSILQDGSSDISAIERSFAQLSLRARQPASQKTPQAGKRAQSDPLQTFSLEMSPLMVIQQCLSSLSLLVQYNQHVPLFFLTEHDATMALKRGSSRKGKGKESKASRYALNALLGLLDKSLIMESSIIMEQLSNLLNSITHPLTMLLKKDKERSVAPPAEGTAAEGSSGAQLAPVEGEQAYNDAPAGATGEPADQDFPDAPTQEASEAAAGTSQPSENRKDVGKTVEGDQRPTKPRALSPPVIPEQNLRLVVNILAARECSAKTFRDTLSTINNLSAIPEAKEVFGKELLRQAQKLGQAILADLTDLIPQIKRAQTNTDVQGMALAKFSPASSDQAKLLRVLTALDYLFDTKKNADKNKTDGGAADGQDNLLNTLYENSTFGPLWSKLSECLSTIRQRENMLNVATILLPLIEALMVVCKNTTLKHTPINKATGKEMSISSPGPESSSESLENLFFNFTEEHRKILNDLVRHNPKLMSGTFCLLVKNPKVLEFDNKRNYFTRRLHSRGAETRHSQPPLQLSVRRDQVFLDSFKSLYFKSGDEMKYGKMSIRFHGEEGVDAGGVTREWFQALSRQMFNPDYALFTPVASDRTTFHPNRLSAINPEHFMFFKFIGRIIGKALYEGRVLDCHFSRAVYKRILGKPVSVKDMETLDLDYYKSLRWMLENDITDIIDVNFAVQSEAFGESQTIDLKESGRNIPVTEENKQEYVRLVVEYRLTVSIQEQLEHFLRGFHDIVPAELISIFNEQELELLISGLPDIDVDDWKNNTEYHNYSASSSQIQWFWRAVRSFDKEERAKLLQFVTGTSKVPLNGFKELEGMNGFSRFNIHRDYVSKDRLPSSHTCFNQLDLPEYESYEALRQQVYTAMTAGSEYFGFA